MKPKEQKLIKIEAPFVDEMPGLAIIKVLDKNVQSTMMLKLKFTCNSAILDVTNAGLETVILNPKEVIGILDLRSLGYYKSRMVYYNKIQANITGLNQQIPYVNNLIHF